MLTLYKSLTIFSIVIRNTIQCFGDGIGGGVHTLWWRVKNGGGGRDLDSFSLILFNDIRHQTSQGPLGFTKLANHGQSQLRDRINDIIWRGSKWLCALLLICI